MWTRLRNIGKTAKLSHFVPLISLATLEANTKRKESSNYAKRTILIKKPNEDPGDLLASIFLEISRKRSLTQSTSLNEPSPNANGKSKKLVASET